MKINDIIESHIKNMQYWDNPFKDSYNKEQNIGEIIKKYSFIEGEEVSKENVKTAGRVIAKRGHGKLSFFDIQDFSGKIQLCFRKDATENFKKIKHLDIGDIIGVEGPVFRTKKHELTILVKNFELLTKNIYPLPEKWHKIQDPEIKYRKRYLHLIMNPQEMEIYVKKSKITKEIRNYLDEKGFIEVETPVLQPIAGGANARQFKTYHNELGIPLYLRIAPELYLKRLIVGGFEKIYEISRVFRNEGISYKHNPEFNMIEIYWAYKNYETMIDLCVDLFHFVMPEKIKYREIEVSNKVRREKMRDLIIKNANVDPLKASLEEMKEILKEVDISKEIAMAKNENDLRGLLMNKIFEEFVEEKLIEPTIVYEFPAVVSPLAKRNKNNPFFADRFELYAFGMELGNGYSELNDPFEQEKIFKWQLENKKYDEESHDFDEDFIEALAYGLPPTGGLGIGLDRWAILYTGVNSIKDVLLFPQMRPKKQENEEKNGKI
jgi:lysyl-tRNA synthetase class 2